MDLNKFKSFCIERREKYSAKKKIWEDLVTTTPNKEETDLVDFYRNGASKIAYFSIMEQIFNKYADTHSKFNGTAILFSLLEDALKASDDIWSGRDNDFRRLCDDAEKEALREITKELKYRGYFEELGF